MADPPDRVAEYAQIFKQLDRQAAAGLLALVASDPQVTSKTAIAQAAVITSYAHAMGWLPPHATAQSLEDESNE